MPTAPSDLIACGLESVYAICRARPGCSRHPDSSQQLHRSGADNACLHVEHLAGGQRGSHWDPREGGDDTTAHAAQTERHLTIAENRCRGHVPIAVGLTTHDGAVRHAVVSARDHAERERGDHQLVRRRYRRQPGMRGLTTSETAPRRCSTREREQTGGRGSRPATPDKGTPQGVSGPVELVVSQGLPDR